MAYIMNRRFTQGVIKTGVFAFILLAGVFYFITDAVFYRICFFRDTRAFLLFAISVPLAFLVTRITFFILLHIATGIDTTIDAFALDEVKRKNMMTLTTFIVVIFAAGATYAFAHFIAYPYAYHAKAFSSLSPLHIAVRKDNIRVVKTLIARGGDVSARDGIGRTPLHYAMRRESLPFITLFVKNGADVNATNAYGVAPLHLAAREGDSNLLALFLAHGGDVHVRDAKGNTPLSLACNTESARILLAHGASVNSVNAEGDTSLHHACVKESEDAIALFLTHGANVDATNAMGRTPLHLAALGNNKGAVRLLLAEGANVNARDSEGMTAIHLAAEKGSVDALALLLDNNTVLLNAKNHRGRTPLHLAASPVRSVATAVDYAETVIRLIGKGARIRIRDNEGETPLTLARSFATTSGKEWDFVVETLRNDGVPNPTNVLFLAVLSNAQQRKGLTFKKQELDKEFHDVIETYKTETPPILFDDTPSLTPSPFSFRPQTPLLLPDEN